MQVEKKVGGIKGTWWWWYIWMRREEKLIGFVCRREKVMAVFFHSLLCRMLQTRDTSHERELFLYFCFIIFCVFHEKPLFFFLSCFWFSFLAFSPPKIRVIPKSNFYGPLMYSDFGSCAFSLFPCPGFTCLICKVDTQEVLLVIGVFLIGAGRTQ